MSIKPASGSWSDFFRLLNEYDVPESNRLKAGKYESLLKCLSDSWGVEAKEENSSIEYLTALRDHYTVKVIPGLREQVASGNREAFNDCYALFTKNRMGEAIEAFFRVVPHDLSKNFHECLQGFYNGLERLPAHFTTSPVNRWVKSARDYCDQGFSPAASGNPFQWFSGVCFFEKVKIIAFGSPTIQQWHLPGIGSSEAQVDPLFTGYLQALEEKGQKHLYASFQDMLTEESARCKALMGIAGKTLLFLSCSKNSPFYKGIGHAVEKQKFLDQLHAQFFSLKMEESGCYLPEGAVDENEARRLLEAVGGFLVSPQSSYLERRAAIDFYYSALIALSALRHSVDFASFTCKDGIDRGMEALAEFSLLLFAIGGVDFEEERVKRLFLEVLFPRAYWARKRPILPERFHAFMENSKVFFEKMKDEEEWRRLQETILNIFGIEAHHVATLY